MSKNNDVAKIVKIGFETKELGYLILKSKGGWHDLKFCSWCTNKKDALEHYYELKAKNIGAKTKWYYKLVKIVADSWNEELANKIDPSGQGVVICERKESEHGNDTLQITNE